MVVWLDRVGVGLGAVWEPEWLAVMEGGGVTLALLTYLVSSYSHFLFVGFIFCIYAILDFRFPFYLRY